MNMLFYQTTPISSRKGKKFNVNQYEEFVDDLTDGKIANIGVLCTYPYHNQIFIEAIVINEDNFDNKEYRLTPDLDLLKFIHQNSEASVKKQIFHYLVQSPLAKEQFKKEDRANIKKWCVRVALRREN